MPMQKPMAPGQGGREKMLPPGQAGQPPVEPGQGPGTEELELLDTVVDSIMDMWRRTGEIQGAPVPDEESALQMAHQLAMEYLAQIRHAQGTQAPEQENPMVAALMGGEM